MMVPNCRAPSLAIRPFLVLLVALSGCNVPTASRDEKRSSSQEDGAPTVVHNQAEFDRLPPGALFIEDGNTFRKATGATGTDRYQVIVAKAATFKVDTATGSTWIFDEKATSWKALPDTPSTDPVGGSAVDDLVRKYGGQAGRVKLVVGSFYETESGDILRYVGAGRFEPRKPLSEFLKK